jgi:glutamate synthase (NADPH/NADH) small chain
MPMMRACVETTRPFGVKTHGVAEHHHGRRHRHVRLVPRHGGRRGAFACVDGPDFDGHQVDFGELLARQKRFKSEEAQANADYAHVCNLEKLLLRQGKRTYKKYGGRARTRWPCPSATR